MPLEFQTYPTVAEAAHAARQPGAAYLGGGTLLVRRANEGDLSFDRYVRTRDPRLGRVEVSGNRVTLGASVTLARIAADPRFAVIAPAARSVGGPAIRNMATIGGNLFAPSPYGDFATTLLALDASVTLGERNLPIEEFLLGRDACADLVTDISFDLPASGSFRFAKVSRVKPKGVSVLSIAALIRVGDTGTVTSARVALGAMADRPVLAAAASAALVGVPLTAQGIAPAVAAIGQDTDPQTDAIASAWYRAEVLPVHFRRLLLA